MDIVDAAVLACHLKLRWSPSDAAWIASVAEYPDLESSHEYSRLAAINGLRDRVREVIVNQQNSGRREPLPGCHHGRQMPSSRGTARAG